MPGIRSGVSGPPIAVAPPQTTPYPPLPGTKVQMIMPVIMDEGMNRYNPYCDEKWFIARTARKKRVRII